MVTFFKATDAIDKLTLAFLDVVVLSLGLALLFALGPSSHDIGQYKIIWGFTSDVGFLDAYLQNRYELGSYFIFWSLAQLLSADMTFYVFGAIALSTKFYLIRSYYNFPLLTFFIYSITFIHILDGNQIRASLAATIVIYALCFTPKSSYSYLVLAVIASLFHYSGIMILVCYFMRAPFLGVFLLIVFGLTFSTVISSFEYFEFARIWLADPDGKVNLSNSAFLMQALLGMVCMVFWTRLDDTEKKAAYLNIFGVIAYVVFLDNAIVAHRIRELSQFGVVALVFLGDGRLTYVRVIACLCLGYIFSYNLVYVIGRLIS